MMSRVFVSFVTVFLVLGCGKPSPVPVSDAELLNQPYRLNIQASPELGCSQVFLWNDKNLNGISDGVTENLTETQVCFTDVADETDVTDGNEGKFKSGTIALDSTEGVQLAYLLTPAKKAVCEFGGVSLSLWIDKNNDGVYQADVDSSVLDFATCHGRDGLPSVSQTKKLEFDELCQGPGTELVTFTDANGNQTFDEGVDANYQRQVICDGADGEDGQDLRKTLEGIYKSGETVLHFDGDRFSSHLNLDGRMSGSIYGRVSLVTMHSGDRILFQPEYFECLSDDQGELQAFNRSEFYNLLETEALKQLVTLGEDFEKTKALRENFENRLQLSNEKLELLKVKKVELDAQIEESLKLSQTSREKLSKLAQSKVELEQKLESAKLALSEKGNKLKEKAGIKAEWLTQKVNFELEMEALGAKNAELGSEVLMTEVAIKRNQQSLNEQKQRLPGIEKSLQNLTRQVTQLEKEVKEKGAGFFGWRARKLANAQQSLSDEKTRYQSVTEQIKYLGEQIAENKLRVEQFRIQKKAVSQELDQTHGKLAEVVKKLTEINLVMGNLQQAIDTASEEVKELTQSSARLVIEGEALEEQLAKVDAAVKTAESEKMDIVKNEKVIDGEIAQTKQSLKAVEAELNYLSLTMLRIERAPGLRTGETAYFYGLSKNGDMSLTPVATKLPPSVLERRDELELPEANVPCSLFVEQLLQ